LSESIRASIERAMSGDTSPPPEAPIEAAPEPAPAPVEEVATTTLPPESPRPRDETGRFIPAKAAKPATEEAPPVAKPAPEKPPEVVAAPIADGKPAPAAVEAIKPPQSLTPAEREEFAKAPPVVQQAIVRRERETQVALREAAQAKHFHQSFQQALAPYQGLIAANGGDPVKAVSGLLQTAQALATAPAQHRAQIVANLVRTYGVDISMLDSALAGEAQQSQGFDKESLLREAEERARKTIEEQQKQAALAQYRTEVEKFASEHEFYEDVRVDMAKFLQAGLANDMEEAYKFACDRHPEIKRVLSQREASKQAATGAQATQRAIAAASPVRAQPTSAVSVGAKSGASVRSAIEAAWDAAEGR